MTATLALLWLKGENPDMLRSRAGMTRQAWRRYLGQHQAALRRAAEKDDR